MALWVCTGCTCAYSVGAPRCPQCGDTDHVEEGAEGMAKITVHGGPTNAAAEPEPEAGEDVSAGTSSSTSSEKEQSSPEPSSKQAPSRARTTGSRSGKGRTGKGSSARSTDGGPEDGTSATADE